MLYLLLRRWRAEILFLLSFKTGLKETPGRRRVPPHPPDPAGLAGQNAISLRSPHDAFCRPPSFAVGRLKSVAAQETDHLPLDPDPVGAEYPSFISRIGGLERDRGAALAQPLERRLLVIDQRDDDIAGFGRLLLTDEDRIVLEYSGLDHRVAAHLEGEVLAAAEKLRRHGEGLEPGLDRRDRGAGRDPAHQRHHDRVALVGVARRRLWPQAPEIAGNDAGRKPLRPRSRDRRRLRQPKDLNGSSAVGEPPNETPLLERHDQAMNSGFRA